MSTRLSRAVIAAFLAASSTAFAIDTDADSDTREVREMHDKLQPNATAPTDDDAQRDSPSTIPQPGTRR